MASLEYKAQHQTREILPENKVEGMDQYLRLSSDRYDNSYADL